MATRKSTRIQDQGMPIQEKASLLKPIHNLDNQGTISNNSFTILNDSSIPYLEEVASVCGISLGGQEKDASIVITAMQAQEKARVAITMDELVSQRDEGKSKSKSGGEQSSVKDSEHIKRGDDTRNNGGIRGVNRDKAGITMDCFSSKSG